MENKSKRMTDSLSKIDKTRSYALDEAIDLIKETSKVKFDASVEVHMRLGISTTKSDQQIRSTVTLPHGTGKTKKIAAFVLKTEGGKGVVRELLEDVLKLNFIQILYTK